MRDLFLVAAIVSLLILTLRKPQVGLLTWLWLSIMNPHKLTYGFLYTYPVLDGLAACTLLSCMIHWNKRAPCDFNITLKLLLLFYIWCTLTTLFAVSFSISIVDWINFSKTLLFILLFSLFMNKRHWIIASVAIFVLSIGYTGFKGGLFTILTGGAYKVWGPPGTAWGDNNGVSVAMLMAFPILTGLASFFQVKFYRLAIYSVSLTFVATILGTQSRGGLVGLLGMSAFALMRSNKKLQSSIIIAIVLVCGFIFMPQSWHNRMASIETYEEDQSASTRIIQWKYAIDISLERPLFGNGFDAFFYKPYYYKYVAHLDQNRSVHSNYFQVLGEQGYIGLLIYILLLFSVIKTANKYTKLTRDSPNLKWASSTLFFIQLSVIGFSFNGLTVNMAYLDLYYYLIIFNVLIISYINKTISNKN